MAGAWPLVLSAATYHVAPDGDDADPGTVAQPWRDLAVAIDRLLPGDTLVLTEGIYRTTDLRPSSQGSAHIEFTIEAVSGADVRIRGSIVVSGWSYVGGGVWRKAGWAENSRRVFVDGKALSRVVPAGTPYDGDLVPRVTGNSSAALVPGSFFYDSGSWELFVRLDGDADPRTTVIEATTEADFPISSLRNYHIRFRNLVFEHSNDSPTMIFRAVTAGSNNWELDHCYFGYGNGRFLHALNEGTFAGFEIGKYQFGPSENRNLQNLEISFLPDGITVELGGIGLFQDGAGGSFMLDKSTDPSSADGGVILAAGDTGVWRRHVNTSKGWLPDWFGAVGDDGKDDTFAFNDLIEAIGSQTATIRIEDEFSVGGTLSFGPNINLEFTDGGLISGHNPTIEINGEIRAPLVQVFDFDLTSGLRGNPVNGVVYPEWFGVDGVDDAPALVQAMNSFDPARRVVMTRSEYVLGSRHLVCRSGVELVGQGMDATTLKVPDGAAWVAQRNDKVIAITTVHPQRNLRDVYIEGFTIDLNFDRQIRNAPGGLYPRSSLAGITLTGYGMTVRDVGIRNQGVGSDGGESFGVLLMGARRYEPVLSFSNGFVAIDESRRPAWLPGDHARFHSPGNSYPANVQPGVEYLVSSVTEQGLGLVRVSDGVPLSVPASIPSDLFIQFIPDNYEPNRIIDCELWTEHPEAGHYANYFDPENPGVPEHTPILIGGWYDDRDPCNPELMTSGGEVLDCTIRDYPYEEGVVQNTNHGITIGPGRNHVIAGNVGMGIENGALIISFYFPSAYAMIKHNAAIACDGLFTAQLGTDEAGRACSQGVVVEDNFFSTQEAPDAGVTVSETENNPLQLIAAFKFISGSEDDTRQVRDILLQRNTIILHENHLLAYMWVTSGEPVRITDVRLEDNTVVFDEAHPLLRPEVGLARSILADYVAPVESDVLEQRRITLKDLSFSERLFQFEAFLPSQRLYQLWGSTDMRQWEPLGRPFPGSDQTVQFEYDWGHPEGQARFFRISSLGERR